MSLLYLFLIITHRMSHRQGPSRMFDQAFKRSTDHAATFEANPLAAAHVCGREVQPATSLLTKELHGDEETHRRTLLDECAAGNVQAYLYTPAKQRCGSLHFPRFFFCLHFIFVHVQFACCACVICHPLGYFQEIEQQTFLVGRLCEDKKSGFRFNLTHCR
jgi:hypothetical protein